MYFMLTTNNKPNTIQLDKIIDKLDPRKKTKNALAVSIIQLVCEVNYHMHPMAVSHKYIWELENSFNWKTYLTGKLF